MNTDPRPIPNLLSIAGTDPTGGAGIQTDLKVFGALGGYGMAVITAVIAQNTCGVQRVAAVEPDMVGAQLDSVFEDVRVDAVKIGMVGNAGIAAAIAERLARHRPPFVVFDPVMAASTRQSLMNDDDLCSIRQNLLPHVTLLTPNLSEAARLLNTSPATDLAGMRACLPALHALGVQNILFKGGHLDGLDAVDLLSTPDGIRTLTTPRIETRHGHGTGCTLSSAIAALWPYFGLEESVKRAKRFLHAALLHADELTVGHGSGPLHHFHELWWKMQSAHA
ncbi:MAG: bifunctional hydroxymethylpyrimidine kinase/phosphomethylpyrimidine kinase [Lautropia sp.]|nr:bifunctional hydroxymethylpyrimidine kinase/phosphomethylpyrimidine kinase [Lautropia sp.]